MSYVLGVDLGTTFTAAAISRNGRAQIVELTTDVAAIPSVVFACDDGSYLTGEAASRRGAAEPDRVAREFKRRIGSADLLLGGVAHSPPSLMSKLLTGVYSTVSAREGEPPERVVLTHPANWPAFKVDLLREAAHMSGLEVTAISEPEAAAIAYAANERVAAGEIVTVYDLGGGTFDASVLRKTETGFEILGQPEGIEQLGGMDFDEAVYHFVLRALPDGAIDTMDFDDPTQTAALAELRAKCVEAKEALSFDTQASIPVFLSTARAQIRLTREEFEVLIRPALTETVLALNRAIRSAGLQPSEVQRVLLVGGSSQIPLVAQMIAAEVGRPVSVDAHPKHTVALGAALSIEGQTTSREAADAELLALAEVAAVAAPDPAVVHATGSPVLSPGLPVPTGPRPRDRRPLLIVGGVVALAIVALAAILVARGHNRSTATSSASTPSAPAVPATSPTSAPASAPPTAAAATKVEHYLPFRVDGTLIVPSTFQSTGNCFTSSDVTSRSDAFRCSSDQSAPNGANLFDPCFQNSNQFSSFEVACPVDAVGKTVAVVTQPSSSAPQNTANSSDSSPPPIWAFTLANGSSCRALSSMIPQVGDLSFPFGCEDGAFATTPSGTGAMNVTRLDSTTNQETTVAVTVALT